MGKQVTTWYLIKCEGEKFCVEVEHYTTNVYIAKKGMMDRFNITQLDIITSSAALSNPWPNVECVKFDGKNL